MHLGCLLLHPDLSVAIGLFGVVEGGVAVVGAAPVASLVLGVVAKVVGALLGEHLVDLFGSLAKGGALFLLVGSVTTAVAISTFVDSSAAGA